MSNASRSSRQQCWDNRDEYYACLTRHNIIAPPGTDMADVKGPLGRGEFAEARSEAERQRTVDIERQQDPCSAQRDMYERTCASSWVDYFNKRRILDERQKKFYADAEARVRR
ncbi:hypothetical protein MVES1_001190 [Malassezia vespertilionis]|uniref:uncharacterized protein n=1 Tax=Malassezia vespertilionis TaxID=2020962 RepID=UPI0024B1A2BC|nr:uncharacterized protein MVES1_001190 [Malassezia vespertilionis]WFD05856.1 hypothetical protein MVES1_001190 [Malassezia vespertilionis]